MKKFSVSLLKLTKILLMFFLSAFLTVNCGKPCYEQNGELPDIDLTKLKPEGKFADPRTTVDPESIEFTKDSTAIISFKKDGKIIQMTYKVKTEETIETSLMKYE